MRVGIIGATGMVGRLMLAIVAERELPIDELRVFSSARSAGQQIEWHGRTLTVEDADQADFSGLDVALFSAGATASRALAPKVAAAGAIVIDNSSAWRMDPAIPLVVSEVNPEALDSIAKGIVANPNCTTMVAMPVMKPLHDRFGLQSMVASTYQAVSGAGLAGVAEIAEQAQKLSGAIDTLATNTSAMSAFTPVQFPAPVAFNVVSLAGDLVDDETVEEHKFRNESQKILGLPNLAVTTTCVRVGVVTGHSVSITAKFAQETTKDEAVEILRAAPAVQVVDVPTAAASVGGNDSLVGRVRVSPHDSHELSLFLSGDNLRKGAALNTVQIAELLLARGNVS